MTLRPAETDAGTLERVRLLRPVQDWAAFRDGERWTELRAVYASDARMAVSWFDGPAGEFVDRCEQMSGGPVVAHHIMGASEITLGRDRALVDSRVTIMMRLLVGGVLCDVTAISRFYDRVVRHDGEWLIAYRVAIFDKDGLHPVYPGEQPAVDRATLDTFPANFRWCCYTLAERGGTPNLSLPAPGSPALAALYAAGRAWLNEASDPARAPRRTT